MVYAIHRIEKSIYWQDRLEEFAQRGEQVNLEKIELSQPFTERVVYPLARRLGEFAIQFTPQNALQATAKKLELAGAGANLDPTLFLAMQFIVAAAFGGVDDPGIFLRKDRLGVRACAFSLSPCLSY